MFHRYFSRRNDGSRSEAGVAMIIAITVVMLLTLITPRSTRRRSSNSRSRVTTRTTRPRRTRPKPASTSTWPTRAERQLLGDDGPDEPGLHQLRPGRRPSANSKSFRYSVDTSSAFTTGIVYQTASGNSRNVIRTVRVGLRRQGFLDYLWLTDHERIDPALRSESDPNCFLYGWQYNPLTSKWGPDPNN